MNDTSEQDSGATLTSSPEAATNPRGVIEAILAGVSKTNGTLSAILGRLGSLETTAGATSDQIGYLPPRSECSPVK